MRIPWSACWQFSVLLFQRISNTLYVAFIHPRTILIHPPTVCSQRGKPCKPYNSVLGENFRMHWDVTPISYDHDDRTPIITTHVDAPPKTEHLHSETTGALNKGGKGPLKSGRVGGFGSLLSMKGWSSPAVDKTSSTVVESNVSAQLSNLSLASTTHTGESGSGSTTSPPTSMSTTAGTLRLAYLTEQISHHPPISAYVASCPARHITLSGIDQLSVRVLPSTSVRVSSGAMNKGFFVSLDGGHGAGERYQTTLPVAHVNGVLRGSFYVTVHESTIITCTGGPGVGNGEFLRAIVEYKEEVRVLLFFIWAVTVSNDHGFRVGSASRTF